MEMPRETGPPNETYDDVIYRWKQNESGVWELVAFKVVVTKVRTGYGMDVDGFLYKKATTSQPSQP